MPTFIEPPVGDVLNRFIDENVNVSVNIDNCNYMIIRNKSIATLGLHPAIEFIGCDVTWIFKNDRMNECMKTHRKILNLFSVKLK